MPKFVGVVSDNHITVVYACFSLMSVMSFDLDNLLSQRESLLGKLTFIEGNINACHLLSLVHFDLIGVLKSDGSF